MKSSLPFCVFLLLVVAPACDDPASDPVEIDVIPDSVGVDLIPDPGEARDVSADTAEATVLDVNPDTTDTAELSSADSSPDSDVLPSDPSIDGPPIAVDRLYVAENPANVLSFFVEWETDVETPTLLVVECDDGFVRDYASDEPTDSHSVFVMGLVEGWSCDFTAVARVDGREGRSVYTLDQVGPIPEEVPDLTATVLDETRVQPGWTIWTLAQADTTGKLVVALFDHDGNYRWYSLPSETSRAGASSDARVIDGGVLVGGWSPFPRAMLVNWEGEIAFEATFRNHHDIRESPFTANHFLFLGWSSENCEGGHIETTVHEYNRDTDEVVWTWRICDHYIPPTVRADWSHVNTVAGVPGERAFLLSSRNQNAIIKVNRDTGEIEWILGGPYNQFTIEPDDEFLRQHAVEAHPNGNILLFDNGEKGNREWSRAAEYELSFDDNGDPATAEIVWEYRDDVLWSSHKSDADRLANGNTLIAYSYAKATTEAVVIEVTEEHDVVWDCRSPPEWRTYRAVRSEPYFGHVIQE